MRSCAQLLRRGLEKTPPGCGRLTIGETSLTGQSRRRRHYHYGGSACTQQCQTVEISVKLRNINRTGAARRLFLAAPFRGSTRGAGRPGSVRTGGIERVLQASSPPVSTRFPPATPAAGEVIDQLNEPSRSSRFFHFSCTMALFCSLPHVKRQTPRHRQVQNTWRKRLFLTRSMLG